MLAVYTLNISKRFLFLLQLAGATSPPEDRRNRREFFILVVELLVSRVMDKVCNVQGTIPGNVNEVDDIWERSRLKGSKRASWKLGESQHTWFVHTYKCSEP